MKQGLGVFEIGALGASLVILDQMEKAAPIRLLQAELNDNYGYVVKILGDPAALRAASERAQATANQMGARCIATVIDAPDDEAWKAIESAAEYQPLIQQEVVFRPTPDPERQTSHKSQTKASAMPSPPPYAIGLIETQGFTAVIEAIDRACKAASVEVIGKEKLGGGYVTVLIKGDVAAVNAAIEAGQEGVEGLGKLIAAHVIARPSSSILALLPESA